MKTEQITITKKGHNHFLTNPNLYQKTLLYKYSFSDVCLVLSFEDCTLFYENCTLDWKKKYSGVFLLKMANLYYPLAVHRLQSLFCFFSHKI